jgi:glutamine phosphoribosylpyrophosphate amidotransferase
MGYKLADTILKTLSPKALKEIDVVIPIPETSNTSAASLSERLKIPYCQGFVKNRYGTYMGSTQFSFVTLLGQEQGYDIGVT